MDSGNRTRRPRQPREALQEQNGSDADAPQDRALHVETAWARPSPNVWQVDHGPVWATDRRPRSRKTGKEAIGTPELLAQALRTEVLTKKFLMSLEPGQYLASNAHRPIGGGEFEFHGDQT